MLWLVAALLASAACWLLLRLVATSAPRVEGSTSANYRDVEFAGEDITVNVQVQLADVAGGLLLALAMALSAAVARQSRVHAQIFGGVAIGAAFLALDELTNVHETIGANLPDLPLFTQPDDLVVALYGVVAAAFVIGHHRAFRIAGGVPLLIAGCVLSVAAIAGDLLRVPWQFEEGLEGVAVLAFIAAFVVVWRSGARVEVAGRADL